MESIQPHKTHLSPTAIRPPGYCIVSEAVRSLSSCESDLQHPRTRRTLSADIAGTFHDADPPRCACSWERLWGMVLGFAALRGGGDADLMLSARGLFHAWVCDKEAQTTALDPEGSLGCR
jgi:hypothetical protein